MSGVMIPFSSHKGITAGHYFVTFEIQMGSAKKGERIIVHLHQCDQVVRITVTRQDQILSTIPPSSLGML